MRALLDTHTLLWWLSDDPQLTPKARKFISATANSCIVSAVSAWEIATKVRIGKLPQAAEVIVDFASQMEQERFEVLPISLDHALRAGLLPGPHRDPFDRMLISQAQAEALPIVGNDRIFDSYGVRRIW